MNKPIILIGDGGHAGVLAEILLSQNREILGYTSPEQKGDFYGLEYLGDDRVITADYSPYEVDLVLGLGTVTVSAHRKRIFNAFKASGYRFSHVIHSSAIISSTAKLGEGVQIMAGVILQAMVEIEDNAIINTGTIIDHDCRIGKHVHIATGTSISGGVQIGESCHIGTGTSIIQGIGIGDETLVGAGSVVVKDIGSRKKVYGVPAKEVSDGNRN